MVEGSEVMRLDALQKTLDFVIVQTAEVSRVADLEALELNLAKFDESKPEAQDDPQINEVSC